MGKWMCDIWEHSVKSKVKDFEVNKAHLLLNKPDNI